MMAVRLLRVMLHLLRGLAISALVFSVAGAARRERSVQKWSKQLLTILRIQVTMPLHAALPAQAALIVANHVSWLDIFVINSQQSCRFVAKADIRGWPVLGWLSEKAGTIFIARGKQREVRRVYEGLVTSLQVGERIAFFPEGTTSAQGTLLPFHANLFEAAIESNKPVQPIALRYLDQQGRLHHAADFIGDATFADSMMLILRSGPIIAELVPLATIDTAGAHRRDLAQQARGAIAESLGYDVNASVSPVAAAADNRSVPAFGPAN